MNASVVIPALNEAGNIADVVTAALAQGVAEVIVVDNGSTDDTAARAAAAGARVVREDRRGYGYASAAGSAAARGDAIVYLDADGSFDPAEMDRLLAPLGRGGVGLVLGSRPAGGIERGAMGAHQRLGNWLAARLMSALYGVHVTDLGPYRAIRADLLRSLGMAEMTYGWPVEMMVKAARCGAGIVEVPVAYRPRRSGQSKVSGTVRGSVLAAYHILAVIARYARQT